jgi:hypothetical protein
MDFSSTTPKALNDFHSTQNSWRIPNFIPRDSKNPTRRPKLQLIRTQTLLRSLTIFRRTLPFNTIINKSLCNARLSDMQNKMNDKNSQVTVAANTTCPSHFVHSDVCFSANVRPPHDYVCCCRKNRDYSKLDQKALQEVAEGGGDFSVPSNVEGMIDQASKVEQTIFQPVEVQEALLDSPRIMTKEERPGHPQRCLVTLHSGQFETNTVGDQGELKGSEQRYHQLSSSPIHSTFRPITSLEQLPCEILPSSSATNLNLENIMKAIPRPPARGSRPSRRFIPSSSLKRLRSRSSDEESELEHDSSPRTTPYALPPSPFSGINIRSTSRPKTAGKRGGTNSPPPPPPPFNGQVLRGYMNNNSVNYIHAGLTYGFGESGEDLIDFSERKVCDSVIQREEQVDTEDMIVEPREFI